MKYDVELLLKNVVCYNLPYELVSFILMDDFKQILKFVLQENCRLCINKFLGMTTYCIEKLRVETKSVELNFFFKYFVTPSKQLMNSLRLF